MPRGIDPTLIILKGHLLIEEELDIFLKAISLAPSYLSGSRLTFYQQLRIMQAIANWPVDEVGEFVEGVGKLRNRLAHNVEVLDLENSLDELLRGFFRQEYVRPRDRRQRARFLKTAFAFTIGALHGFSEGFTLKPGKSQAPSSATRK